MKSWLWFVGLLAAVCWLSRLPHPAVDVGQLEPVELAAVDWRAGEYHIQTDTGAEGSGATLTEAARDLLARASGTVFLETAEFVLLAPGTPVTEEFCAVLRPACRVCVADPGTDPAEAAAYLRAHPPKWTLNDLRAGEKEPEWLEMEGAADGTT